MPRFDPVSHRHHPVPGEAALVRKHRGFAEAIATAYFIPGADRDDVRQEAMIALLVAARTYDGQIPFKSFVWLAVHRWLQTEVTRARREKRKPLSEALRFEGGEEGFMDTLVDPNGDVLELVVLREDIGRLLAAIKTLSALERRALLMIVNDEHPHAGGHNKQLDNAVQRARRKLAEAA